MKVCITGAAGFIGSHVTERLLQRGHNVVGVDNFDTFYAPSIKRENIREAQSHPAFRMVEGDIRDERLISDLFSAEKPDAVIHLAARAGVRPSLLQAPLYVDVNLTGTVRLLEASRAHGVRRFVFASSSSVYGARPSEPFREDDNVDHPVSPYAATKKAGELLCYTYHHLYGLHVTCLRFFTVYGPRQRPEMAIHTFSRSVSRGEPIQVFGDGSALRDFTYIDDITDGVEAAFERCLGYRVYNLGNGNSVELRSVIRSIERELDRTADIRFLPMEPGDVPTTLADTTRARAELGYEPKVLIEEGIHRFVRWLREREEGP